MAINDWTRPIQRCEKCEINTNALHPQFDKYDFIWRHVSAACRYANCELRRRKRKGKTKINEKDGMCRSNPSPSTLTVYTLHLFTAFFIRRSRFAPKCQWRVQLLHFIPCSLLFAVSPAREQASAEPNISCRVIYAAFTLHFYFKSERKQKENVRIVNAFTPGLDYYYYYWNGCWLCREFVNAMCSLFPMPLVRVTGRDHTAPRTAHTVFYAPS